MCYNENRKDGEGMYIDYSNLWKLLAQKGLTKSDLIQLTGLSSRIIAKLAKNVPYNIGNCDRKGIITWRRSGS